MNEERKIETEEVEAVTPPPRARVTPEFERKRDYLAGFLSGETKPTGRWRRRTRICRRRSSMR